MEGAFPFACARATSYCNFFFLCESNSIVMVSRAFDGEFSIIRSCDCAVQVFLFVLIHEGEHVPAWTVAFIVPKHGITADNRSC